MIVAVSPYGKDDYAAIEMFRGTPRAHIGHLEISDHVSFEAPDPGFWCMHGYAVLQVDVRGQMESEGDFAPHSRREQPDYKQIIAWAACQGWCTGSVALMGVSYLAISQWGVAQHRPEALKAIIPWEGWTNPYLRAFHGGIPEVRFREWIANEWVAPRRNREAREMAPAPGQTADDHPLFDEFWEAKQFDLGRIDVPALICASFSDQGLHSRDSFDAFAQIGSKDKWLFSHRRPKWEAFYRSDATAFQLQFLDHFVKKMDNGFERIPRIHLEINSDRETYEAFEAPNWPIDAAIVSLHLDATSGALESTQDLSSASTTFDLDTGQLCFTAMVAEDIDIVGTGKLKLWIELEEGDDIDLFVGVTKLDRSGKSVPFYGFGGLNPDDIVSRGWLRVSHRELDEGASTPLRPVHQHRRRKMLSASEIVPVEIELMPSATRFSAGDRLQLVVQGHQILPDTELLHYRSHRGRARLHTGGAYNSHILLPSIDRTDLGAKRAKYP